MVSTSITVLSLPERFVAAVANCQRQYDQTSFKPACAGDPATDVNEGKLRAFRLAKICIVSLWYRCGWPRSTEIGGHLKRQTGSSEQRRKTGNDVSEG